MPASGGCVVRTHMRDSADGPVPVVGQSPRGSARGNPASITAAPAPSTGSSSSTGSSGGRDSGGVGGRAHQKANADGPGGSVGQRGGAAVALAMDEAAKAAVCEAGERRMSGAPAGGAGGGNGGGDDGDGAQELQLFASTG